MHRPLRSTSTRSALRNLVFIGLALNVLLTGVALAGDERGDSTQIFRPNADWRAQGLAYVDLPLQIRARFDASYTHHAYDSDSLSEHYLTPGRSGPGIVTSKSLESRIAFSRPLTNRVELEIAWQTRNRVATSDLMGFGRQIVGAMIRITP